MKASLQFGGVTNSMAVADVSNVLSSASVPYSFVSSVYVGRSTANPRFMALSAHSYLTFNIVTKVFRVILARNTGDSIVESLLPFNFGQWYRLGFTWDGIVTNQPKLYVNGVDVSVSVALGSGTLPSISLLGLGNRSTGLNPLAGNMCDTGLYTRVLTPAEMARDYVSPLSVSTLAGRWLLNEGAGGTAFDTSGNGNNATITNAIFTVDTPTKARQLVNANLVYNGDFEYAPPFVAAGNTASKMIDGTAAGSTSNTLFGWGVPTAGAVSSSTWQFDGAEKYSGNYSMKLSALDVTGSVTVANYGTVPAVASLAIPVQPNTSYTLTARVKTSSVPTNGAYIRLRLLDSAKSTTTTTLSNRLSGTNDWTLCSIVLTTGASDKYALVMMNLDPGAISSAWFDNISLTPTTPVTRSLATRTRKLVGEMVENGDFEYSPPFTAVQQAVLRWVDGTAAGSAANRQYGWYVFDMTLTGASVRFDPTVYRSGTVSLKLSITDSFARAIQIFNQSSPFRAIPVLPNTSYTLTYWLKTVRTSGSSSGAFATISERDSSGGLVAQTDGTFISTTVDWTKYSVTVTTAATTRYIMVKLSNLGSIGAANLVMDAWFDDISLMPTVPVTRQKVL
jgi:concanavalin A-like lectin/glucanase superfamily protein/carbohydrate binding protein with CBM4/9 domain